MDNLALTAYWASKGPTAGPFGGAGPTWAKALDLGLDRDPNARDRAFGLALATLTPGPDTHRTRLALAGAYLALGGNPRNLTAWGFTDLRGAKALARGLTLWARGNLFFSTWYAR